MGILEESKVVQVINRLESSRELLEEVNANDTRFSEKIAPMTKKLNEYEKVLTEIKKQLNIENLGVKEHQQ